MPASALAHVRLLYEQLVVEQIRFAAAKKGLGNSGQIRMQTKLAKRIVRLPQAQIAVKTAFVGFIAVVERTRIANIVFDRIGQLPQVGAADHFAQCNRAVLVIRVDIRLRDVIRQFGSRVESLAIPAQYRLHDAQGKSLEVAADFAWSNSGTLRSHLLAKNNRRLGKWSILRIFYV